GRLRMSAFLRASIGEGSWEASISFLKRIGTMNLLQNGARLCAEHQPQHVRTYRGAANCSGTSRFARALRLVLWTQPRSGAEVHGEPQPPKMDAHRCHEPTA